MLTLSNIMTSSVITVSPETTMREVVSCMEKRNISSLIVTQDNRPVGIFTERSLLRLKIAGDFDFAVPIQEVMTADLISANENMGSHEAYQLFLQHNIRRLIVVDDEEMLAGVVTETDFCRNLGLEYFVAFDEVSNIMTTNILTLQEEDPVVSAMQLMNDNNISSIIIENDNYPVGVITERDIVRLIKTDVDVFNTPLCNVMTSPVYTVPNNTPSHKVANVMRGKNIRRLVVTDQGGKLVGIATATDIIKGLKSDYTNLLKEVIATQAEQLQTARRQLDDKTILECVINSASDIGFVVSDLDYRILYYNKAAEKIFGYTAQDVLNSTIPKILGKEGVGLGRLKKVEKIIKSEGKYHFIHDRQRDNNICHIESNIFAIWNKWQNIQGFVLIANNITELIQTEEHLRKRSQELEETNAALRVLLKQRELDKEDLGKQLQSNIEQLVLPLFAKLRKTTLSDTQDNVIRSIETNLHDINSPFSHQLSSLYSKLTPAEVQVANLIKNGHTSKEIADLLNLSSATIYTHRKNIRKKSGISNKKVNLQTILGQMQ